MDDTGVYYISYDPQTIWDNMMMAYMAAGGDVLYPGDEKEILLRAVQQMIVQNFASIDNALRMATRRYAVRDYLDIYGEKEYCDRIAAVAASAVVQITFSAGSDMSTIPAGKTLTEDGVTLFALDSAVTPQDTTRHTAIVSITCTRAGSAGNSLLAGAQMQFIGAVDRVEQVVCIDSAVGGRDAEDDESYRARIGEYGYNKTAAGTKPYYEGRAMASSSGILDASAIRTDDGEVTVYLLLEEMSEAEKRAVIQAATAALISDDARALTDRLLVEEAQAVSYTLNVSCVLQDGASGSALQAAVKEYQTWQERKIGRPFNPDKLMALLYQAGAQRVSFGEGCVLDGESAAYTVFEDGQYCQGTVNLTIVSE